MSNGSSDSDTDNYSYGSGRRIRANAAAGSSTSSSVQFTHHSGMDGPMILKPSNPEYSDILLQVTLGFCANLNYINESSTMKFRSLKTKFFYITLLLLQEIARLSEQQRREAAITSSNPSSSSIQQSFSCFSALSTSSTSNQLDHQLPSTSNNVAQNNHANQQMDLTTIANQYNRDSVLPLRLNGEQNGKTTMRSQSLSG